MPRRTTPAPATQRVAAVLHRVVLCCKPQQSARLRGDLPLDARAGERGFVDSKQTGGEAQRRDGHELARVVGRRGELGVAEVQHRTQLRDQPEWAYIVVEMRRRLRR